MITSKDRGFHVYLNRKHHYYDIWDSSIMYLAYGVEFTIGNWTSNSYQTAGSIGDIEYKVAIL